MISFEDVGLMCIISRAMIWWCGKLLKTAIGSLRKLLNPSLWLKIHWTWVLYMETYKTSAMYKELRGEKQHVGWKKLFFSNYWEKKTLSNMSYYLLAHTYTFVTLLISKVTHPITSCFILFLKTLFLSYTKESTIWHLWQL